MTVEQIYTGCLAHGAYYIESNGEAAIIDPLREVQPYLTRAARSRAQIRYVFETHFHADFVSGHLDLSKKTGAKIVYGPNAAPDFDFYAAKDEELIPIGNIKIKVLHTPGHTMESTCFLLIDEQGKETALFSGDTLFIGDVGRPDLAQKINPELTMDKLAAHLYHSIQTKIMPLADDIIIYPGHGAGSACGKNMSKETTDTLGNQKKHNYALRADITAKEFIAEVTAGLLPPPGYFPQNVMMNIQGYEAIDHVIDRGLHSFTAENFELIANSTSALILDTRDPQSFARGFIPNAINIGIEGSFAPWAGTMIHGVQQKILFIADEGRETEVVTRLARVGYDHTIGYLKGGFQAWELSGKETDHIKSISAEEFSELAAADPVDILDVRKESEYQSQHVLNALPMSLEYLNDHLAYIDKQKTYYVYCAGGYRSMIFISILRARGFENLVDIKGGFQAIKQNGRMALSASLCY